MSILQVTGGELVEHTIIPGEDLHHRLNTIEARRFIFGLTNGERKTFESLVDKDGKPNFRDQETYMIQRWSDAHDYASIAGHNTSRALQSVRHFLESNLETAEESEDNAHVKRFYYPLLETPKAPFIADLHWDQESRFRRGIGKVIARTVKAHGDVFQLPELVRGETAPEPARHAALSLGRLAAENTVLVLENGEPIGSNYVFAISSRPAAEA